MKPPAYIEKMLFGFIESQILFSCDKLGIFTHLIQHGASSSQTLSYALDLPMSALERLLGGAVCIGLLTYTQNNYQIKPELINFFDKQHTDYCGSLFSHYHSMTYCLFSHLAQAVVENQPQWQHVNLNTKPSGNLYLDYIYTDSRATDDFLTTMWASGYRDSLELCKSYTLQSYQHLVDIGGASGSFTVAALQNNPLLKATIFDLTPVEPFATAKLTEFALSERAKFVAGDMFKDKLPAADIYVIGYVLSDFADQACIELINKCYAQLPENGLIIILEKYLNDDKSGPYLTAMMNLVMLVEMQGRHRHYHEYVSWLQQVGFSQIQTIYSSGEKNMLIGKKAAQ